MPDEVCELTRNYAKVLMCFKLDFHSIDKYSIWLAKSYADNTLSLVICCNLTLLIIYKSFTFSWWSSRYVVIWIFDICKIWEVSKKVKGFYKAKDICRLQNIEEIRRKYAKNSLREKKHFERFHFLSSNFSIPSSNASSLSSSPSPSSWFSFYTSRNSPSPSALHSHSPSHEGPYAHLTAFSQLPRRINIGNHYEICHWDPKKEGKNHSPRLSRSRAAALKVEDHWRSSRSVTLNHSCRCVRGMSFSCPLKPGIVTPLLSSPPPPPFPRMLGGKGEGEEGARTF